MSFLRMNRKGKRMAKRLMKRKVKTEDKMKVKGRPTRCKPPTLDTQSYVCKSPIEGGISFEKWMYELYGF